MKFESGSALLNHPEFPREKLLKLYRDPSYDRDAVITADELALAVCRFQAEQETVRMAVSFLYDETESASKALGYISEQLTRRFQPKRILTETSDPFMIRVLQGCGYFSKGKYYQRRIEPWRQAVPDSCFDEEGYIIHQGQMDALPFGWFHTDAKGCGWIAAFNLMKMEHRELPMQMIAEGLDERAILGHVMGQSEFLLWVWLKDHGLPVKMSAPFDRHAVEKMKQSRSGILLYSHTRGAHYCAYRSQNDGTMHFYNAVYGRKNHIMTPEEFLKQYALFPFSSAIYIERSA